MKHKTRENDTVALAGPRSGTIDQNVSVRKIDNGYVTRVSHWNPDTGEGHSKEQFSKDAPKIGTVEFPQSSDGHSGGNSLAGAVGYLKG